MSLVILGRSRVIAGERQLDVAAVSGPSTAVENLGDLLLGDQRGDRLIVRQVQARAVGGHVSSKVASPVAGLELDQSYTTCRLLSSHRPPTCSQRSRERPPTCTSNEPELSTSRWYAKW